MGEYLLLGHILFRGLSCFCAIQELRVRVVISQAVAIRRPSFAGSVAKQHVVHVPQMIPKLFMSFAEAVPACRITFQ